MRKQFYKEKFLSGAVKLTHTVKRNTIKRKFIYKVYGVKFDGTGPWSFRNEFVRNLIFGVDNI